MPKSPKSLAVAVLIIVAMLLLGGCSASVSVGSGGYDAGDAAQKISKAVEHQNPGIKVKSVVCPADVDTATGTKADCTLTLKGGNTQKVHITMTDGDGSFDYTTD
jgi:ABC-type glycerol-3-phosphate transport system substrate-binding protein